MALFPFSFMQAQGPTYDPDALAFFARVTTAGGSLSNTEKTAVNQLVLDMKSYGIWTAMKAVYPMVGASAAACAQNLVSSSFTGTFTSGWTFASTGATPNGTSAYMDTNYLESGNALNNNVHLSFYSRTQNNALMADIGAVDTSTIGYSNIFTLFDNVQSVVACQSILVSSFIPNTSSLGFFVGNRTTSTDLALFIRNTKNTSTVNASNLLTIPYYIGARNLNNSANSFSSRQCAFASMGLGLTDTQASNFYTAVQAFQTTLSRQV